MRDGGGFTQLQMYGNWDDVPAEQFVAEARADAAEVGNMAHFEPRDWMCEPLIINGGWAGKLYFVGTKLSVRRHQELTVADYLDLVGRAPELPWLPVLQGWTMDDYLRCADLYYRAGVSLHTLPLVGVGTICRRQGTKEAARILGRLASEGFHLHAFGLKETGIPNVAPFLESSDSMAWSYAARRRAPLPECEAERAKTGRGHRNCANCARFAFRWLEEIEREIVAHQDRSYQTAMAI